MNCLSGQIETLRQQLLETVAHYSGDFLTPDVLRLSLELDLLIVQVQRKQRRIAICFDACHSEA